MLLLRSIFIILCLLSFISCSKKNALADVELTIVNDTLYFYDIKNSPFGDNDYKRYDYERARDYSYNAVRYSLTNNTDKKLLFFIRDIDLIDIYGLETLIKHDKDTLISSSPLVNFSIEGDSCRMNYAWEKYIINEKKLRKLGAKRVTDLSRGYISYLTQSVVLNPGETREFQSIISLPFMVEMDYRIGQNPFYYELNGRFDYTFSLKYEISKGELIHQLKSSQIEELENNNIEIFDGKLFSNEVKLVGRK